MSNPRVERDWEETNHGLLRWTRIILHTGLAEKNRNLSKLACKGFIFTPHSPGECTHVRKVEGDKY